MDNIHYLLYESFKRNSFYTSCCDCSGHSIPVLAWLDLSQFVFRSWSADLSLCVMACSRSRWAYLSHSKYFWRLCSYDSALFRIRIRHPFLTLRYVHLQLCQRLLSHTLSVCHHRQYMFGRGHCVQSHGFSGSIAHTSAIASCHMYWSASSVRVDHLP